MVDTTIDTFEDGEYTEGPYEESVEEAEEVEMMSDQDDSGQEESEGEERQAAEKVESFDDEGEEIDPDSQVNNLETKEDTGVEEKKAESDKEDEKSAKSDEDEGSDAESKDDATDDAGKDAEPVRTIKAFQDGKRYEVPEEATVKVKVAGKSEKVSIAELRDNYSGKVAWEDKFNKLSEERQSFDTEREQYQAEIDTVRQEFGQIRNLINEGLKGEVDPTSAFTYLLDLMGFNSVQYNKTMREHLSSEMEIYNEMTDAEKDAYWYKKERDYLTDKQESAAKRSQETQAQQERSQKIAQLRETHGVSEDDYLSAYKELEEMGKTPEEISPELVVQTAKLIPLMDAAEELMEPYKDQLDSEEEDRFIRQIAVTMYESPDITIEDVKAHLAKEFEVEDVVAQLETKIREPEKAEGSSIRTKKNTVHEYESWDDFDY